MAQDEDVGAGREGDGTVWVIFDQDADRHCPYLTKKCGFSVLISGISDPLIWFSNCFGVEEGIFHGVSRTLHSHLNSKLVVVCPSLPVSQTTRRNELKPFGKALWFIGPTNINYRVQKVDINPTTSKNIQVSHKYRQKKGRK